MIGEIRDDWDKAIAPWDPEGWSREVVERQRSVRLWRRRAIQRRTLHHLLRSETRFCCPKYRPSTLIGVGTPVRCRASLPSSICGGSKRAERHHCSCRRPSHGPVKSRKAYQSPEVARPPIRPFVVGATRSKALMGQGHERCGNKKRSWRWQTESAKSTDTKLIQQRKH